MSSTWDEQHIFPAQGTHVLPFFWVIYTIFGFFPETVNEVNLIYFIFSNNVT